MNAPAAPAQTWTLRHRIGAAAAVVGGVLAVLVAAVVVCTIEFVSAGNRVVYHWEPAVSASDHLLTDLVEQQSSLRGYALSGDTRFATEYRQAVRAQHADMARARAVLADDAQLNRRLTALDSAAADWQRRVAEPALGGLATGDRRAAALVSGSAARGLFEAVRGQADALSAGVQDRARSARATRSTFGVVYAIAITLTALILLVLAAAVWRGLHRWVLAPVERLAEQTREVARGQTYRQITAAGPREFATLGRDVEAMRLQIAGQLARAEEIQEELMRRGAELSRSNEDLQQFAYVASHDLSEPLRKVANFCQLLERQYRDQLDDRAKQYIDFAVDGAKRMQVLISDLLALSRVGRTTEQFVPVDLDAALDAALGHLDDKIAEAGARIERLTPLPTVSGDTALLTSLMENLVGNALKYRRPDEAPVVRIRAEHDPADGQWTLRISDNGIGIDPQYAERIFAIFQRLHVRDSYGGTGIGLALCRRIVEFHGGHIWLDTVQSAEGATFAFALPEGGTVAEPRH